MRSHIRRLLESAGFSPRQLFAALQGAWLEPKQGLIWQENTGITPTTTGGQTIGLMLDQSQGAVLGPELVTNGTFDANTTGWTPSLSTLSVVDGELVVTGNVGASYPAAEYAFATGVGKVYRVTGQFRRGTSVNPACAVIKAPTNYSNIASNNTTTTASFTIIFIAPLTTVTLVLFEFGVSAGGTTIFDNISVRQILGNHAYQSSASSRPTLQFSGALPLARFDTNDSLTLSLPDLGGGVFSASGSVYFSTPVGMSQLNNQSMGTAYTLPALSTDIYAWMVFPQRLSAVQESKLAVYMQQKAGIAGPDYFEQVDYGPELVTNGTFDTDTSGWIGYISTSTLNNSIISWVNSSALVTNNTGSSASCRIRTTDGITVSAGKTYQIQISIPSKSSAASISVGISTSAGASVAAVLGSITATGAYTYTWLATGTYLAPVAFSTLNNNESYSIDSVSVRELKDGITGQLSDDAGDLIFTAQ